MKTTKKILSVILAVMLLVGTVAVGVSADGSLLTEKSGSKLVYSATADKAANEDGVIELIPGETITVSVYMQANYYIGTTGSEIFAWTDGFFNNLTADDWSIHNLINDYTPNQKYPVSANQLGTGYSTGYTGFLFGRAYSTNCTSPADISTATLAYKFVLTVPETATVGATGKFIMPETCSATVATNSRMRQIYASVNNSATTYNSSTEASQYPETIDLTATELNFVVVSAEETPVLGEITNVVVSSTRIGETADTNVSVTGAPESLRVITPAGETTYSRDDANIEATESGETWTINILATAKENSCTVYANYGEAGETEGYDFSFTAIGKCNYDDLNTAIRQYETDLNDKALYTADSWKEYEDAYTAATKVTPDMYDEGDNQDTIDTAEQALKDAKAGLDLIEYCSYTLLNTAVNNCSELDADEDYYDPEDLQTWKDALDAAEKLLAVKDTAPLVKSDENQATLDDAAKALTDAYDALVEMYVNTDELRATVGACDELDYAEEYYDATEYAAWKAALKAANDGLVDYDGKPDTAANREAVAGLASDLQTAYDALDARFVNLDALTQTVGTCDELDYAEEYYDATEYAAWEAALDAARKGLVDYDGKPDTAANREAVAGLASDLQTAYDALDARFVNLDALTQAVADYAEPEKAAAYYDTTEYAAWEAALAAAQKGLVDYDHKADTAANREAVAGLAADLKAAYEELDARSINYYVLETAVENYGTTPEEADAYTAETYGPYAAALERANTMLANKVDAPASDTELAAQITAAASELESTFNNLKLAPVNAIITSAAAKQEFYKVGDTVNFDFVCSVTNVAKVQIVYENGTTVTYHRGHSAVTVVDNGDGTETWTIAMKIYYDQATATAKAKLGNVWEEGGYKFNIQTRSDEDYSVKSAEVLLNDVAVTEFTTDDTVVIKIVCGPSTLRMRLVDQTNGATATYSRTTATQDANGNWVWLITRKAGAGAYAYDIYTTGGANRLVDEGTDLTYTVTAPVVVVGPSTGSDADIVVSATVAKARVLRGNDQTFTIVTDTNALGVRVMDQYGIVQTYTKDATTAIDNGDGTLTWVITTTCTRADTYTCAIEALYGSSWMSNGTTVTYKVAY